MTKPIFNRYSWLACLFGMLVTSVSYTAPGTIADAPLFTATSTAAGVPSNIIFQLDDSGSMAWDILTKKYWRQCMYDPALSVCSSSGSPPENALQNDGNFEGTGGDVSGVSSSNTDWRVRSSAMNILYYNPNVTYVPWKNGDGTSWANASLLTSSFKFHVWRDSHGYTGSQPDRNNGGSSISRKVGTVITTTKHKALNRTIGANGMVDYWDEHTTYTVPTTGNITQQDVTYTSTVTAPTGSLSTAPCPVPNPTSYATVVCSNSNKLITITINDSVTLNTVNATAVSLSTGLNGRTLAQERQNIANWNTYYRDRISVAKGSIGQVIDANPKYRYGLNTIWNRAFVEVPSQFDPATSSTVRTDFVTPNKALLTTLYGLSPSDGTPLPDALERVGKYFKNADIPKAASNTSGVSTSTTLTADTYSSTASNHYAKPIVFECQQNFSILFTDGYWNSNLGTQGNTTIITPSDVDADGNAKTLADVARYYYITDLNTSMLNKVPANTDPTFTDSPAAIWQHMVTFTVAFGLSGNKVDTDNDGWPNPILTESSDWGSPSTANSGENPDNIDDLWHAAFNGRGQYVSASSPEEVSAGFASILSNIAKRDYIGSSTSASFNVSTISGGNSAYVSQFGLVSNVWSGDLLSYYVDPTTGAIGATPRWKAATLLDALNASDAAAAASSRHIFTYNPASKKGVPFNWTALNSGTTASPTISTAQKDLGTDTSGNVPALTTNASDSINLPAIARLNYLRGDQSNENAGYYFRDRSYTDTKTPPVTHKNLLGDIIHSDPLLVSTPQGAWPTRSPFPTATGTRYRDFKTQYTTTTRRAPMVYVGANDGMLHAFNANTGVEAMAYIPNALFSFGVVSTGLHYLTDPRYVGQNHRYYVDGPTVAEDVYIDTGSVVGVGGSGARWHSVLVGGLMAGGRGIYALDVTDPSLFLTENATNAAKIGLWEFNSTHDADVGYTFAVPSIVMMNNGRWAAVFGNGYNNTSSGKAVLFIVFLDGGVDGVWTDGTASTPQDYIKITVTNPSTNPNGADSIVSSDCLNASSNCNGLSTPQPVDLNADSVIDRIYAGDLKGNMWAFDVSKVIATATPVTSADWKSAYGTVSSPAPLFTASHHVTPYSTATPPVAGIPVQQRRCGTTASPQVCRQAITSRPTVIQNKKSYGYNPPNTLVMFGTGQYLNVADTGNLDMQGFYAVWDHGVGSLTPATPTLISATGTATTAGFVEQTFLPGPFYNNATPPVDITNEVRVLTSNPVNYNGTTTTNHGWFINLSKAAGERQVVNADVIDEKYLFFNTWIPGQTTSITTESCTVEGNSSGAGYLMSVDLFTGGSADTPLFDLNGVGGITAADKVQNSPTATTRQVYTPAGRAYNSGLPGSSSFVKGTQYTPGTDAGTNLSGTTVIAATGEQMRRRAWQELRSQ